MKRPLLSALAACAAAALSAADPYIGYIYPPAIQAGTTNKFVIGGQALGGNLQAWVSGAGVRVLDVEPVPGFPNPDKTQRDYLKDWLDAIAEGRTEPPPVPELKPAEAWLTNRWWEVLGTLGPKERAIVARDVWIRRNALQAAPSLKQLALVTLAADADAPRGARQVRLFRNGDGSISAPRPLIVTDEPVLEEPLYTPPSRKDAAPPPVLVESLPAVAVGQVLPEERDFVRVRLAAGQKVCASVTGRALQPYVGDAVPGFFNPVARVTGPDGAEVAFADDDGFSPDPAFAFTAEAEGEYVVEIADRLFRGREDFVYALRLAADPPEKGAADLFAAVPPRRRLPAIRTFAGDFADGARHAFEVTEPGPLVFELYARRLGTAADGVLALEDAEGNALARWDDVTNAVHVGAIIQQETDPSGTYDFAQAGRYALRVSETCGRGGAYELVVRRPVPHFRVYAKRSGFNLARGQRTPFAVLVDRREGFAGPVRLTGNAYCALENAEIPADATQAEVVAVGVAGEPSPPAFAPIFAVGEMDGEALAAKVVAGDEYNQAFAWDHILSMGDFVFRCRKAPKRK